MADLNPLKFSVAIQDDATKELAKIEAALNSLKDKTISVKVDGLSDLQQLLSSLQHIQVQNIGKDVGASINEATKNLQSEAQKAIRESLGKLAADLVAVKEAIQHDNFTAFSTRITKCAEAVDTLDAAFKKFHVTIGQDEGMRNFMTGLGEVIRNVRSTMGMLNGGMQGAAATPDAMSRSVKVARHETERLNNDLVRAQRVIETFGDKGFNVAALERYKTALIDVRENLRLIERNGGVHPLSGLTASQYLTSEDASRVISLLKTELSYYNNISRELERITNLRGSLASLLSSSPNTSYRGDINHAIAGLDLREGLIARQGARDAMQTLNSSEYRDQIREAVSLISKVSSESRQSAKDTAHLVESMRRAGIAVSDLAAKFDKLEIAKIRANAVDAKVDTTAYDKAVERMERYRRVLEYIAKTGGHDADRITQSVGYRNASNDLNIQAAALKALTKEANTASTATNQLSAEQQRLAQALETSTSKLHGQSQVLNDLKSLATQYLGVWGGQQFLNNIIQIGGQLEQQRLSMGAILSDADKANEIFGQIKALAVKSPFGVVQLDQMSKQLAAYGFIADELFDWTKRLADISAATGTDVSRLSLALGHVRSEGALSGYTLRQFAMGNVPMLRMLSENRGVSTREIRDLVRKKEISDKEVEGVLIQLTSEGGMFYEAQEVMSQALNAKYKNLKDAFDIMFGEIAESGVGDVLKDIAATLTDGAKEWKRFGTDILSVAAAFGIARAAMIIYTTAYVNGMGKQTAATLSNIAVVKRQEVERLRQNYALGLLTKAEYKKAILTEKLTVSTLKLSLAEKKLTIEELQRAVALGKVDKGLAIAAASQAGLDTAIISSTTRLKLWQRWWFYTKEAAIVSIRAIGAAMKSLLPMLAIGGAVDMFMRNSHQKERAADFGETASKSLWKDFSDVNELYNELSTKKPKGLDEAADSINRMKEALRGIGRYDAGLQERVNGTEDLSKQYDILYHELEKISQEYVTMAENAKYYLSIANQTGGGIFSDNMLEDIKDFGKANTALRIARMELNKFGATMKSEIKAFLGSSNEWRAEYENMSWKDLYNKVLNARGRDRFTSYMNYRWYQGNDYEKQLLKDLYDKLIEYRTAINNFYDAEDEIDSQMGEYIKNLQVPLADRMAALGYKWDEKYRWSPDALHAFGDTVNKLVQAYVDNGEIDTDTAKKLQDKILKSFLSDEQILTVKTKVDVEIEDNRVGWQKEIQQYFDEHGIDIKVTADTKMEDLIDDLKKNKKKLQEDIDKNGAILINVGLDLSNLPKEGDELGQRVAGAVGRFFRFFGNSVAMQALINYRNQTNLLDAYDQLEKDKGFDLSDNKKNDGGKGEDKNAKAVREKVRIMKEAADAFKYWKEKVGEKGGWSHVLNEFGDVLEKIGMTAESVEDLRSHLNGVLKSSEFAAINDSKVKLEIEKEIANELAQLDRKDFEKNTERFVSQLTRDIDELTRKWEIFNSVRESTGDIALASRMSGLAPGATPADLKRANVASFAGADIDFDAVLDMSGEEIDEYVYTLHIAQEKIKGVQNGLKDWKKAQEDLTKSDIQNYAKWLGTLVDYESQRVRIQNEYNTALEETNRLLKEGIITAEEARRREISAQVAAETKGKENESWYANLYGNANVMAKNEFNTAYQAELDNLDQQLSTGQITLSTYTEKLMKLNKIAAEFSESGFLGINGGVGSYISGGVNGLIGYYRYRAKKAVNDYGENSDEAKKWNDRANSLEKMQKAAEQVAHVFNDLAEGTNMIANMFDALGNTSAANAFSDVGSVLSGVGSGAMSLSSLGPWGMAAGAGLGLISGIAQTHDKALEREISGLREDVQKIENNTSLILQARERTLGFDTGDLRRSYMAQYAPDKTLAKKYLEQGNIFKAISVALNGGFDSEAQRAMYDYYKTNSTGTGYQQQYQNLLDERQNYMDMYNAEQDKKKSSAEALEEYRNKIAELDDEIRFFTLDLAKQLFDIDVKGWADQLSDALSSAFENGESAAKAYKDTVTHILQQVMNKMMQMAILEPMFANLEEKLFGSVEKGTKGVFNAKDPKSSMAAVTSTITNFFGKGGEGEQTITAALEFMNAFERGLNNAGLSVMNDSANTLSSSVQGTSEETSDLLAGYVNALRQDVSINRIMLNQFVSELWPLYVEQVASAIRSINNIDQNVAFIRTLLSENGAIYVMIDSMKSHLDNITNGNEQISVK